MLIQEKIAIAAIVLAAASHLGRLLILKSRARTPELACGGCGCSRKPGTGLPATKAINGSGKPAGIFHSQR